MNCSSEVTFTAAVARSIQRYGQPKALRDGTRLLMGKLGRVEAEVSSPPDANATMSNTLSVGTGPTLNTQSLFTSRTTQKIPGMLVDSVHEAFNIKHPLQRSTL